MFIVIILINIAILMVFVGVTGLSSLLILIVGLLIGLLIFKLSDTSCQSYQSCQAEQSYQSEQSCQSDHSCVRPDISDQLSYLGHKNSLRSRNKADTRHFSTDMHVIDSVNERRSTYSEPWYDRNPIVL